MGISHDGLAVRLQAQQAGLLRDEKIVFTVDHRFALSNLRWLARHLKIQFQSLLTDLGVQRRQIDRLCRSGTAAKCGGRVLKQLPAPLSDLFLTQAELRY
jgi:hypothetical protein